MTGPLVPLPVNGKLSAPAVGCVPGELVVLGTVLPWPFTVVSVAGFVVEVVEIVVVPRTPVFDVVTGDVVPVAGEVVGVAGAVVATSIGAVVGEVVGPAWDVVVDADVVVVTHHAQIVVVGYVVVAVVVVGGCVVEVVVVVLHEAELRTTDPPSTAA
ncbi:MAG: hypothetical protein ACLPVY_16305 [Acidimicrobiia bacterium]